MFPQSRYLNDPPWKRLRKSIVASCYHSIYSYSRLPWIDAAGETDVLVVKITLAACGRTQIVIHRTERTEVRAAEIDVLKHSVEDRRSADYVGDAGLTVQVRHRSRLKFLFIQFNIS